MHGLINRSLERFVRDGYGDAAWLDVAARAGVEEGRFEGFRSYPDALTLRVVQVSGERLAKPAAELLEDLGAWLARTEPIRRLLRFSGSDFADFILALEELPGRVGMVLPDLALPRIAVATTGSGQFQVSVGSALPEWRSVLAGMMRAMSDDYGALALIIDEGRHIAVDVSDETFCEGRDFDLWAGVDSLKVARR